MFPMLQPQDLFAAYLNHPDIQPEHNTYAAMLCERVNALLSDFVADGNEPLQRSPVTRSLVSVRGGGWRPPNAPGARRSAHKVAGAVDLHDPDARLDKWIMAHPDMLEKHDLYMEHPSATQGQVTKGGWCHLSIVAPASGNRVFYP